MTAPDLKPCPFCGTDKVAVCQSERTDPVFWVECIRCNAEAQPSTDKAKAIAAWNRRATPDATDPKVKALEAWIKQHGIHAEDCDTVTKQDEYDLDFDMETICTCGLTEILAALREGAEETKWLTQLTR